jgi:hypothetical protein
MKNKLPLGLNDWPPACKPDTLNLFDLVNINYHDNTVIYQ